MDREPSRTPAIQEGRSQLDAHAACDPQAGRSKAEHDRFSAARLRDAQAAAHFGTFRWDVKTDRAEWSDELYRIFGRERASFQASFSSFLAQIHPDDRAVIQANVRRAVADVKDYSHEYRIVRPDGQQRWVRTIGRVARDDSGAVTGLEGTCQDITDQKHSEQVAEHSERLALATIDALAARICVLDEHGVIITVNRAWREFAERNPPYPVGFGVGVNYLTVCERATGPASETALGAATGLRSVLSGESDRFQLEYACPTATGEQWFVVRFSRFTVPDAFRVVVSHEDITERRAAQEREKKESAFREAIIRGANDGICVCHAIDEFPFVRFTIWNERMHRITGYTLDEINRLGWYQTVYPDPAVQNAAIRRMDEMRRGDDLVGEEWTVTCKDGGRRTLSISTSVVDSEDGPPSVVALMHDITERKQAEDNRKRLETQLFHAQKIEAIGRLAGGVAHDFNNMLTVIFGHCMMLQKSPLNDEASRASLDAIRQAGEQAAALTKQLLALGRQAVLEPKVLNPNAALSDAEKLLRRAVGENVELSLRLAPDVRNIRFDPGQFVQVLLNLAINARDAMPQGGRLTISTANARPAGRKGRARTPRVAPDMVALVFRDSGEGMTPEVRARIFEPFFTTKPIGEGSGLGLAVVHGIVTQSGGSIEVESAAGAGATVRILLPAVTDDATPDAASASPSVPRGNETVLLVEDSKGVSEVTSAFLRAFGYTVVEAPNGGEAVRAADAMKRLDLLLTDVIMPESNGREVAELLRARRPGLAVLFMSGYPNDALVRDPFTGERVGFISKPFAPSELARKVRDVLDRRP